MYLKQIALINNGHKIRYVFRVNTYFSLYKLIYKVVPGGGFEPPTRGFSVHCSTPELPGHGFNDKIAIMG